MRNLDKYKDDLQKLIETGVALQLGMYKDAGKLSEQDSKSDIKPIDFNRNYEAWYSEAREIVRQLLPNRLEDFVRLYERDRRRKELSYENYVISDYMIGLIARLGGTIKVDTSAAIPKFQQQLLILISARDRLKSSLYDIRQVVQADLFDSELDAARELTKNGYLRASGALTGVVIETHLQQVCNDHNLKVTKKNPGINDLAHILKEAYVIDTPTLRRIQILADIRNVCDHKKTKEPTKDDIDDLITGADKVIKTVF